MSDATEHAAPSRRADRRPPRILVVDDERSMRELLAIVLRREGYEVLLAENGRAAIELLEREPVDLLISDIKMPDMSGVDVLRAAKHIDQDILGIMITAFASTDTAVEAMRLGACDYLSKPFDIDLLKMKVREKIENRQLRQENVLLKRTLGLSHQFSNIIGRSEAMLDVFKMIETVARTNSTILLTGESGTGKGLVAQAIHFHSLRRDKPMVSLNCGALPETLLESELFGHMRGAFTGADANKKGLLEVAEKRHDLPRRDRRDERRDAGEAAARAAGAPLPPRRRPRGTAGRHPRHRRDQPGPDEASSPKGGSARTSSTGSTSSRSRCRRCASAARTSRCSPSTSSRSTPSRWGSRSPASRTRRWTCCGSYDWPGNIRELENVDRAGGGARSRRRPSCPTACRRRSAATSGRAPAARTPPPRRCPTPASISKRTSRKSSAAISPRRCKRAGGVQVKAAELLGMSFRSFRYYVKKYNLR